MCCIHKSLVTYAVMFWVYNFGLLNENREYIQSLCFSWLRLSAPRLALSTPQLLFQAEKAEKGSLLGRASSEVGKLA